MTSLYPILRGFRKGAVFSFDPRRSVTTEMFLSEAAALARVLPNHRYMVNLCKDRYRFTVGLAAALMREQVSLMPPNDLPTMLGELASAYPDLYCFHDGNELTSPLSVMAYPEIAASRPVTDSVPAFPGGQPAVVLFTSGSSGAPVPQMKPWGQLVASAQAAGSRLGVSALTGATVIGTVPQQHSYGLESTVLLAMQHGLALHGERPFYPDDIAACIAASPLPRILVTTPIHLRAMLAASEDAIRMDLIISATAPLAPQLAKAAEERFHAPLLEIYGCSEAGQLATRRTVADESWHCLDGVHLHQVNGETWVSGALVERQIMLNDIIELRDPDQFVLFGRRTDLVNIAGKRTSLIYLNHHLNSIPGVVDGIFVMPDEEDSAPMTRLIAFVVAPDLTRASILAELRRRIDAAFLPRPLLLVDVLPRNHLGKVTREALLRLVSGQRR